VELPQDLRRHAIDDRVMLGGEGVLQRGADRSHAPNLLAHNRDCRSVPDLEDHWRQVVLHSRQHLGYPGLLESHQQPQCRMDQKQDSVARWGQDMLALRVRREGRLSGRPCMWLIVLWAERNVDVDVLNCEEVNGVSQTRHEVWGIAGLQGTPLIGRLGISRRSSICA